MTILDKEKIQVINLQNNPSLNSEQIYIPSKQSANVLFRFMNKLEFLEDIILKKAIIPRYYEEKLDYLQLDSLEKIAIPMSCFCDIHLNKLAPHMENYGLYGIGLSKEWGIKRGIQPIHYVNQHSNLLSDFKEVINKTLSAQTEEERSTYTVYNNLILHQLFYMKPIEGEMRYSVQNKSKYEKRNFHDEKEWRFIPNINGIDTDLPLVISQDHLNPKSYNTYSDGLRHKPELWLDFEYDAIKYIIVNDQADRSELISYIVHNCKISEIEKYTLISKILVFNELKEDW